jgi:23S rRNA pseudouridine2605 synthase
VAEKRFNPKTKVKSDAETPSHSMDEPKRLNKYLSNAGICSRREADVHIANGEVKVNGKIVTELGFKVSPGDRVEYNGNQLTGEKYRYILLNKPKDFICTLKDEKDRKTVMDLVKKACDERIFPVGRLDRQTTGLLLFTNDGELANNLSHPSSRVKKLYQAGLNKDLEISDYEKIKNTVVLEDGPVPVDDVALSVEGDHMVGIEIHIGRNRIVRRLFESLGYTVEKLDRSVYAGLTKKDLPRGKWRHLTEREVQTLKRIKAKVKTQMPPSKFNEEE